MAKIKIKHVRGYGPRGWSAWQYPTPTKYLMTCCDCGLVHEMEFKAFQVKSTWKDGRMVLRPMPAKRFRAGLRARRADKRTAAYRKHVGIVVEK
jgi:hypothetical protein